MIFCSLKLQFACQKQIIFFLSCRLLAADYWQRLNFENSNIMPDAVGGGITLVTTIKEGKVWHLFFLFERA